MKQTEKLGKRNEIGAYGEEITKKYLKKQGFSILDQNYLKKWGEIDIIAKKHNKIRFVEVKTVSYETINDLNNAVSYGTWRPEENVTARKLYKMNRTIETWLEEQKEDLISWQIDVAAIRVVPCAKYATIKYIENIIL
jgi:putative endonuclease